MKKRTSYLRVKDHSVSGETFDLIYDAELDFLKTSPEPKEENLSEYYQTEDYISHTDSKRNLLERVYHVVRGISLKRKLKLINSFSVTEKKLLDVGCGTGDFLQMAQANHWDVYGIEPNEQARHIANRKTNDAVNDNKHLLELEKHSFDVITLWHVLEHLPNLDDHIAILKSLLKPNGRLIIAVPNFRSHDANHYKSFWAAFDVPRHLWHFSQESISKLFGRENITVEKILPMKFDAFYVCLLSEKYKSGIMNPFKAFWNALQSNLKAKHSGEYSSLIYILKNRKTNL